MAFVLNFLFPILLLVSRYSKRIPGFLTFVSVFILLGHHSHSMNHNAGGSGHAIPGAMPAAPPPPQRR